jgi:hypothetical protein
MYKPEKEKNVFRSFTCVFAIVLLTLSSPSCGADVDDLIGKWKWQDFVVEVVHCKTASICARVVAGPKRVGMEIFGSS